jgi:hypothetical protein
LVLDFKEGGSKTGDFELENLGREDEGGRGEEEKFMSMVP